VMVQAAQGLVIFVLLAFDTPALAQWRAGTPAPKKALGTERADA
jgi:hypothetical protein